MATYTKQLKTITIAFMAAGQTPVTVADTATNPAASNALAEFLAYKTMHVPQGGVEMLIPFHAVAAVSVSVQSTEVTKADPYGCDEETTEPDGE